MARTKPVPPPTSFKSCCCNKQILTDQTFQKVESRGLTDTGLVSWHSAKSAGDVLAANMPSKHAVRVSAATRGSKHAVRGISAATRGSKHAVRGISAATRDSKHAAAAVPPAAAAAAAGTVGLTT
ncbi:hypothetical protein THAOC_30536 [Thalassiosira oceanica]|uniref:Uncharacterized protein n=1 Tax=Thalassiosira oceanica TaxID=159749 RepID=K0RUT2_THAOC|nr:hypothetical protein THAOC_30536 [Thalassiosira oceanica]|eukprot:EJK50472.1 hypothetical protein THAOC_30536 [Thalassiosira oceanica]